MPVAKKKAAKKVAKTKTARQKSTAKKTASKSSASAQAGKEKTLNPPTVEKDDSKVIEKIKSNNDDDSAGTVEKISDDKSVVVDDSDLTPTVSADSEAIQKTKSKKAKGRPMKRSTSKSKKSDKSNPVDDGIAQLLKPDALKTIITIANNRLREAGSIWAMPDGECDDMANAIIGVVDKYFPELDEWSVEATLIITASIYAIPRFMMMKQSKADAPKVEPVKQAEPELEKVPPVEPQKSTDSRLDALK